MTRLPVLVLVLIGSGIALPADIPPPRPARSPAEVEAMLARGKAFAARGDIDLFVAATAAWKLPESDVRLWEPAHAVGRSAVAKAGITHADRKPDGPTKCGDFRTYRSGMMPGLVRTDGTYRRPLNDVHLYPSRVNVIEAVQAAGVDNPQWINGLVVSRGPVSAKGPINASLILANGDVTAGHKLNGSVVICDGDVSVKSHTARCLVIARGKIAIGGRASGCTLIAGSTVTIGMPEDLTNSPRVEFDLLYNDIREKEAKPLGYIRFFELSRVGVEVSAADGGVRVTGLTARGPFAAAGVQNGDVITKVGGTAVGSPEELRRRLRDASATKGEARLTIRRGGETVELRVVIPD